MHTENENPANNKTCSDCGKTFRTPANLLTHKNRKTPCVNKLNICDELNPNRCIKCNRILSNRSNLNKHYTRCTVRDSAWACEKESRILKEQFIMVAEQVTLLTEQLKELKKESAKSVTINNTNHNVTNNITINNYLQPNIDHLLQKQSDGQTKLHSLFTEHRLDTPLKLVPLIWFNPEVPENISIYLVNKITGETLAHDGVKWRTTDKSAVSDAIRNYVYHFIIDNEHSEQAPGSYLFNSTQDVDVWRLMTRRDDKNAALNDLKNIKSIIQENRDLAKQHVSKIVS